MEIIDLSPTNEPRIRQTAAVLVDAFRPDYPESWPDMEAALKEVAESLTPDRISRIALDERGDVIGWIGAISMYEGRVWELHPLAVRPSEQRRGVGRTLVADLEEQVRRRGGLTIYLGADDISGTTSLGGADIYPNVWEHVARIRNLKGHPYEFYQKCGFVITGVVPDANGLGKPDILMSKRVGKPIS